MADDLTGTVKHVEDDMPFHWRVTHKGEGLLGVEVGNDFVPAAVFGDEPEGNLHQIGVAMVMNGIRLLGLSHEEAKALTLLALKMTGRDEEDTDG